MPQPGRDPATVNFHAAIAQWRLQLRTEVKRASSLPTAMFDACDPMLETRLAQTAEELLGCLQEPDPTQLAAAADGEQRLETVSSAELRAFTQRIKQASCEPPDLERGQLAEFRAILGDTCLTSGELQQRAVRRLCSDFGIASRQDLDQLLRDLLAQTSKLDTACDAAATSNLLQTCAAIDAALQRHGLLPVHGAP